MKQNQSIIIVVIVAMVAIILMVVISKPKLSYPEKTLVGEAKGGKPSTGASPQCSDHLDNDGDGSCDYNVRRAYCSDGSVLGDSGCSSKEDNNEADQACAPSTEICDGKDNDCDTLVDEDNVCVSELEYDGCYELYPGTNIINANRINFVVQCVNYPDLQACKDDAKMSFELNSLYSAVGVMELSIWKDNKNKVNVWYTQLYNKAPLKDPSSCTWDTCRCHEYCNYHSQPWTNQPPNNLCSGLSNMHVVNLCNMECRGTGYFNGPSYNNRYYDSRRINKIYQVVRHEVHHQVGGIELADEYYETGFGDYPRYPNCADSLTQANTYWGGLIGTTCDGQTTNYFSGCSYVVDNYRPTTDSIMKSSSSVALGCVNQRRVQEKFNAMSGTSSGFGYGMAVEIDTSQEPFEIVGIKSIEGFFKEKKDGKFRVNINSESKVFTQSFDSETIEIVEGIKDNGNVAPSIKKIRLDMVIVEVGLPQGISYGKEKDKINDKGALKEYDIKISKNE